MYYAVEEPIIWLGILLLFAIPSIIAFLILCFLKKYFYIVLIGLSVIIAMIFGSLWFNAYIDYKRNGYDDGSSSMAEFTFALSLVSMTIFDIIAIVICKLRRCGTDKRT